MFSPLALIEGIGGPELLTIMFIVLLLFGSNRLPELAKGLGKSMREFKKATSSVEAEVRRAMEEEPTPPAKRPAPPVSIQSTKPAAIQPGSSPDRSATPPPPPDIAD